MGGLAFHTAAGALYLCVSQDECLREAVHARRDVQLPLLLPDGTIPLPTQAITCLPLCLHACFLATALAAIPPYAPPGNEDTLADVDICLLYVVVKFEYSIEI